MKEGEGEQGDSNPRGGGDVYRELFTRIRDGYARVDLDGRIVESNQPFRDSIGYSEEELLELTYSDITPEKWHAHEAQFVDEQVMVRGYSDLYEKEHIHKDGHVFPVELIVYQSTDRNGNPTGMWAYVRNIYDRKTTEEELRKSIAFERLITTISNDFINVPPEEIDAEIAHALRLVGEFADVDRAYVFHFSEDGSILSNTHEWCAKGIIPQMERLQGIPTEGFGWSVDRIRHLDVVNFTNLSEMPTEADPERQEFEREGIRSIAFVPISRRGEATGFIGFDAVRSSKVWSEETITLLRIVGDIFANALERKRTSQELAAEHIMRETIIDTSPVGIVTVDPAGNITFANTQAEQVLGLETSAITDRTYNDPGWHITDYDGGEFPEEKLPFHRVMTTRSSVRDVRHAIVWPDGTRKLLSINAKPLVDADGGFKGMVATVADVTERIRHQQELTESEEKYRNVVERATDAIAITVEGVVKYLSPRIEEISGFPVENYIGTPFIDHVDPDQREWLMDRYKKRMAGEEFPPFYEISILKEDGSLTPVEVNAGVITYEGAPANLAFIRDISRRKEAELSIRESEERFRVMFENSHDLLAVTDDTGKIIWTNPAWQRTLGYVNPSEIDTKELTHPDELEGLSEIFGRLDDDPEAFTNVQHRYRTANGKWIHLETTARKAEVAEKVRWFYASHDISDRMRAAETIRDTEERSRTIIESNPMGMHMYELRPNGDLVFVAANPAADRILGVDNSQFIGRTIEEAFPPLEDTEIPEAYRNVAANGLPFDTEQISYEDGAISGAFEVHAFQTSPERMVAMFQDISAKLRTEKAVKESEERYRSLFEDSTDMIFVTSVEGKLHSINPAGMETLGITEGDLVKLNVRSLYIHPEDRDRFMEEVMEIGFTKEFETQIRTLKGAIIDCLITSSAIRDDNGNVTGFQGIIHDITARKLAEAAIEEREKRLQSIFSAAPIGIGLVSEERKIFGANDGLLNMLGYPEEEIVGQSDRKIYSSEEEAERVGKEMVSQLREQGTGTVETVWRTKDGSMMDVLVSTSQIDTSDRSAGFTFTALDITNRKRSEELIKTSLREKEVLLKEIHHRVKNNMQVISSLMSLQAGYIEEEDMLAIFRESQTRVRSMALIHDKLYQSVDLGKIDFHEYVQSLGYHLFHTYGVDAEKIRFDLRGEELLLGIDKGVPCGLIVNELISNSLKHAFPGDGKGKITVDIGEKDGRVGIVVKDNGKGFPDDIDFRNTETLGLELVTTLTAQIEGEISLGKGKGTVFTIEFTDDSGVETDDGEGLSGTPDLGGDEA